LLVKNRGRRSIQNRFGAAKQRVVVRNRLSSDPGETGRSVKQACSGLDSACLCARFRVTNARTVPDEIERFH
jgi:hypothetical protein